MILFIVAGCATPSSPTGGPPDKEGPKIIKTEPQTGTTNFSDDQIILHFSEFVERSSLEQAIVIEPDVGITYELDWGRKSVAVEFDSPIPDSTTLILSVGTDFKDVRGNTMAEPQKIAVSTGPEIDKGSLVGAIKNAQTGEGTDGDRVLLYREPIKLEEKADYIAETDTAGNFTFSYLREGKYKAFWVEDRNRNKTWERDQERAQPFNKEFFELEKEATDTLGTIFKTPIDTTKPALQGVGLFSSQRLRMRFSENIILTDSAHIVITDTLGAPKVEAYPLYIQPSERFVLFGHSQKPLSESQNYSVEMKGITDEKGNPLADISQNFTGSAQEDTTKQRIVERNTVTGYFPEDTISITYAKPFEDSAIKDSVKVVEGDTLLTDWPGVITSRNILSIHPKERWKDGINYEIRVWDPFIEDYRKFSPEIWHTTKMGTISVTVADTTIGEVYLEITNEEAGFHRDTVFTDSIEVSKLPPLEYTVTVFDDLNGNNSWDFGSVAPFEAPEPYFIQRKVPVKKAMTGELTITFE